MTDTRWMTYDELAEALGITPDSARRLVARRKWPRRPGNDGKARIGVPVERLTEKPPVVSPDVMSDNTPDSPPDAGGGTGDDITLTVRVLSQHIERLEKELEAVKAERDAERARAAGVEALQAVLEIERKRLEDLRQERERWASQAERLTQPAPTKRGWWPF